MSQVPSIPKIADVRKLILASFDVTAEEAHGLAMRLLPTAEAPGTTGSGRQLDWAFCVKHELADKLRWRSDSEREQFKLESALAKPVDLPPKETLADLVRQGEVAAVRQTIEALIQKQPVDGSVIEAMKSFAGALLPRPCQAREPLPLRSLRFEAIVALLSAREDKFVLRLLGETVDRAKAESHEGFNQVILKQVIILAAMDHKAAAEILRRLLDDVKLWSIRIACLYALPEAKADGTYRLIEDFRLWLNGLDLANLAIHVRNRVMAWRDFLACLNLGRLRELSLHHKDWPGAPYSELSPLIGWCLENGNAGWLVSELRWLYEHGSGDFVVLRNAMVEGGVEAAVDICAEQIQKSLPEDYVGYGIIHRVLTRYPKPLPSNALEMCLEVIRHPCHPAQYEHRIDAINFLAAAAKRNYRTDEIKQLVIELAQTEYDPDVRIAAIKLVPWASPSRSREVLVGALAHQSSNIREAAQSALRQVEETQLS